MFTNLRSLTDTVFDRGHIVDSSVEPAYRSLLRRRHEGVEGSNRETVFDLGRVAEGKVVSVDVRQRNGGGRRNNTVPASVFREGRCLEERNPVFVNEAVGADASLIVMGAFGQPRLREFLLGSATCTALKNSPIPLFLYH